MTPPSVGTWRLAALVLLAVLPGCRHAAAVDLVVLAPHPDDEVLMAGGVLERARAEGRRAAVVLLTNGDATCARDGAARQRESLEALAQLGVPRERVHFLGFPDGHLAELGVTPLQVERRDLSGACVRATTAAHDAQPPLTATSLVGALSTVLARLAPRDVYLPHPIDEHPDHAATWAFFRRALEHLAVAPVTHRAVVHQGDCWPQSGAAREPCGGARAAPEAPVPPLPPPLTAYAPDERVAVDGAKKLAAIATFASQTEGPVEQSWLSSFARAEEVFWLERFERGPAGGWVTAPPAPTRRLTLAEDVTVDDVLVRVGPGEVQLVGPGLARRWLVPAGSAPLVLELEPRAEERAVRWRLWGARGLIGEATRRSLP